MAHDEPEAAERPTPTPMPMPRLSEKLREIFGTGSAVAGGAVAGGGTDTGAGDMSGGARDPDASR